MSILYWGVRGEIFSWFLIKRVLAAILSGQKQVMVPTNAGVSSRALEESVVMLRAHEEARRVERAIVQALIDR